MQSFQLFRILGLIDKMNWTDQDKCQRIDTGLKDVDEVGGDDANATQLGIDGGHEDAEHPSPIQVLQRCNEPRFFLLPLQCLARLNVRQQLAD